MQFFLSKNTNSTLFLHQTNIKWLVFNVKFYRIEKDGRGKTDVLFNYVLECGNLLLLARDAARTSQNTSSVLVAAFGGHEFFQAHP